MDKLQIRLAALSMAIDVYKTPTDEQLSLDEIMNHANTFNDFLLEDVVAFEKEQEAAASGDIIQVDFTGEIANEDEEE